MTLYKNIDLKKVDRQQKGKAKYIIEEKEYFAEEAAINYYENLGYNAIWSENVYWWTLMCLFFWDVIFSKTKGAVKVTIGGTETELEPSDKTFNQVFKQTIQMNGMPSDFFTPKFYERRKKLIENKITELQNIDLEQKLRKSFNKNYGKNCRPIENWDKFKIDELLIAIKKVGKEKIVKIFERLISNFTNNRSGLPDLIVYNNKEFFFSEVKSEKDEISEKQKEWHEFLSKTLGFKVEILCINQTKKQLKKTKSPQISKQKEVTISFAYSSSAKRKEAISFISKQNSYFTQKKGKEKIHGAKFKLNENNIEKLFKFLDLTSRWKSQKIEIDGEIIKSTKLRSSLQCFREKNEKNASSDYCKKREHDNKINKLGCNNIYFRELEDERWESYGYINTSIGDWVFDHKKIREKFEKITDRVKYCPLFDKKKGLNLIKKIPKKVNPKKDVNWVFIDNDYHEWIWYKNKWINRLGETNFPGLSTIVGVQKKSKQERDKAIRWFKNSSSTTSYEKISQKQQSNCFIATATYGVNHYQVKTLKRFRDRKLKENILGRIFIKAYYIASPPLANIIREHKNLKIITRKILNVVIRIIKNSDL